MSYRGPFTLRSERGARERAELRHLDVRPDRWRARTQDGRTNPDGTPYVLTEEQLLKKLPNILDFNRVYLGIDPITEMMPIQPTAITRWRHFHQQVRRGGDRRKTLSSPGCTPPANAPACPCMGANRLGMQFTLDILRVPASTRNARGGVFQADGVRELQTIPTAGARAQFSALRSGAGTENHSTLPPNSRM